MSAALRLAGVRIEIGGRVLIPSLDLQVAPGETVTLMGPSGAGKSTLLSFIGGTLGAPFRAWGRVWLGERELGLLPAERRRIGILFQDDLLFPHLTVGENLAFGLTDSVRGRAARAARIEAALLDAGLPGLADRASTSLSGGERARIALMRLLLAAPGALLLDEPFNSLDAARRAEFRRFVFEHARAAALPVLLVTHDEADAEAAGGPVLELSDEGPERSIRSRAGTAAGPSAAAVSRPAE